MLWEEQSARTSGSRQVRSEQPGSRREHATDPAHERLLLNPIEVMGGVFPDFIRLGNRANILLEPSVPT